MTQATRTMGEVAEAMIASAHANPARRGWIVLRWALANRKADVVARLLPISHGFVMGQGGQWEPHAIKMSLGSLAVMRSMVDHFGDRAVALWEATLRTEPGVANMYPEAAVFCASWRAQRAVVDTLEREVRP